MELRVTADIPAALPQTSRLHYLDNLKVFLTVLVILHHAGQPYGPGGWWPFEQAARSPYLGILFAVNETFFMCLFFFVSGYFLPGAVDRKGPWPFIRDRLLRLGVPLLAFLFAVTPFFMYASYLTFRGGDLPFFQYYWEIYLGIGGQPAGWPGPVWPDMQPGHLWFIQHLLVYALIYGAWRLLVPRKPDAKPGKAPGGWAIFGYALAMAAIVYVVRLWYPVQWERVLIFQVQIGRLPQYIALFILGAVAYRRGWLDRLSSPANVRWLWLGAALILGSVTFILLGIRLGPIGQRVLDVTWENLTGISLMVGLAALFRKRYNQTGHLWRTLSDSAYAAYIIHVAVVVLLQYALAGVNLGPLVKFLLVSLAGVPLSFGIGHLLLRLPGARSIL